MSLKITDECINCGACEPDCPNEAITEGDDVYIIDAARCTECVGHFDEPKCKEVCPDDEEYICMGVTESQDVLKARFESLQA